MSPRAVTTRPVTLARGRTRPLAKKDNPRFVLRGTALQMRLVKECSLISFASLLSRLQSSYFKQVQARKFIAQVEPYGWTPAYVLLRYAFKFAAPVDALFDVMRKPTMQEMIQVESEQTGLKGAAKGHHPRLDPIFAS